MELTKQFEKALLKQIAKYTPLPESHVLRVWEKCGKSYDKTIFCLQIAQRLGVEAEELAQGFLKSKS
jgi:hypothetical protein